VLSGNIHRLFAITLLLVVNLADARPWVEVSSRFAADVSAASCNGVRVRSGANLRNVVGSHAAGTTYCLSAGKFPVNAPIAMEVGDRIIGAGHDRTFIDGSGLSERAEGIFLTNTGTRFANFDISGARTPQAGSGASCSPSTNCGRAFVLRGGSLTLRSIDCHDNGGNCIGGGGSANVTVIKLNCYENGSPYSASPAFAYAACIKRAAVYSSGGDTTVRNSYIHDNYFNGLWCDHCKVGFFKVEGSHIIHNGASGILWEMSGGWSSNDHALIRNDVFHGNNWRKQEDFRGGVGISTANDITVRGSTFGRNSLHGVSVIFSASRNPPQPDSGGVRIQDNSMNGNDIRGCELAGVVCSGNN
jgi:Right handed beta helix region